MKKKMLSMAAVITMAVFVLTGCSNAFSSASIAKTAQKYGMDEANSYSQYMRYFLSYDEGTDTSIYYVAEDSKEALHMYDTAFAVPLGASPAMEVKVSKYQTSCIPLLIVVFCNISTLNYTRKEIFTGVYSECFLN